jgi:hypothetical protein
VELVIFWVFTVTRQKIPRRNLYFIPLFCFRQKGPCTTYYLPPISLIWLSCGDWLLGIVIGNGASPTLASLVALGARARSICLLNSEGVSHPA